MTEGCKRKMGKAHPRSKAMKVVIPLPMKVLLLCKPKYVSMPE